MSDSLWPHGQWSLPGWDFSGKSTGVGCHFLLQGLFLTQGSNQSLPPLQADILPYEPPGKPLAPSSLFNIFTQIISNSFFFPWHLFLWLRGLFFPGGSDGKASAYYAGDPGSISSGKFHYLGHWYVLVPNVRLFIQQNTMKKTVAQKRENQMFQCYLHGRIFV